MEAMCVLLFPDNAPRDFDGFGERLDGALDGLETLPSNEAKARMDQLHDTEMALLGSEYLETRRIARWPLGRVRLPAATGAGEPQSADVFLVTHTAGAALWEAWIPIPEQPLDAERFVAWLRSDTTTSAAGVVKQCLASVSRQISTWGGIEDCFPFTILRHPGDEPTLDTIAAENGGDLVRILYLDWSRLAFKKAVIAEELARDFCLREGGISLLSPRGALDLRTGEGLPTMPDGSLVLAPRSALPLLISVELLLIERAVLKLFHERMPDAEAPGSLSRLVKLKAELLDGLEEYRGTVAESNRFSSQVTAYGEQVLGLDVSYRALIEQLDGVTFEITTRYQQTTNLLQFALTVVFGALQASSVAAVIAAVHYQHEPIYVLAWAAGVGCSAASLIALLLRRRLH